MQLGRNPTKPSRLLVRYGQAMGNVDTCPFCVLGTQTLSRTIKAHTAKATLGRVREKLRPRRRASRHRRRSAAVVHFVVPSAARLSTIEVVRPFLTFDTSARASAAASSLIPGRVHR